MLGCENAVKFYRTSAVEYLLGGGGFVLLLYGSEVFHGSHVALFARWCWGRVPCWFCGRTHGGWRTTSERHRTCHLVCGYFPRRYRSHSRCHHWWRGGFAGVLQEEGPSPERSTGSAQVRVRVRSGLTKRCTRHRRHSVNSWYAVHRGGGAGELCRWADMMRSIR